MVIAEHQSIYRATAHFSDPLRHGRDGRSRLRFRAAAGTPGEARDRGAHPRLSRRRGRDATTIGAHGQLLRALKAWRGAALTIGQSNQRPWASALFLGARHRIEVTAAEAPVGLEDHEFAMTGHFVASIAVEEHADGRWVIEALTIETGA